MRHFLAVNTSQVVFIKGSLALSKNYLPKKHDAHKQLIWWTRLNLRHGRKKVLVFTFLIKHQCLDSQSCNIPCVAWITWMAFFEVCLNYLRKIQKLNNSFLVWEQFWNSFLKIKAKPFSVRAEGFVRYPKTNTKEVRQGTNVIY